MNKKSTETKEEIIEDEVLEDKETIDLSEEESEIKEDEAGEEEEKDPIKILEAKLDESETKYNEAYDRLLRATADFENQKKRSEKQMDGFRKFANESIIKELLSLTDNLERALSVTDSKDECEKVFEGVNLIYKDILKVLENNNTKSIDALEKPFDPAFHQAVLQEETDEFPEGVVIKELQKGYLLHDRLVRPSMVVVSKAKC
jgi:molecular chaperone GrpE